jgi:hypothetical protein
VGVTSYGRQLGVYSAARLGLFLATCVALAAFGLRGFPLLATGLLASSVVGIFALRRLRDAFVDAASERTAQRRAERERLRSLLDDDAGGAAP